MDPIQARLDKVSSCFCTAKWLQVTLRLQNGHTHSCHHPQAHKVPLKELKKSPSALHNTEAKKKTRKQMLKGTRPSECSYCWKVEDLPGQHLSDRHYKSGDKWSTPYLEEVASLPWNSNVNPRYLEVSFSNICNFKCAYCYPDVSSRWMSEVVEHGPYPTTDFFGSLAYLKKQGTMPLPEANNPYIKAFWQWLPEIISGLHVLRVTGGEPLLAKDSLKLLEFLEQNPAPHLNLSFNSNLGIASDWVSNILQKLKSLNNSGKIQEAQIFTSLDTWGEQAEYIRFGLDLDLWKRNLQLCLAESDSIQITIMVTFNILSLDRFGEFLHFVLHCKQQHQGRLGIDISVLHIPEFLSPQILSERQRQKIDSHLTQMKNHSASRVDFGFADHEIAKLERLKELLEVPLPAPELKKRRMNFVSFIEEYDRRKKTDFLTTFPQMDVEWHEWQLLLRSRPLVSQAALETLRLGQKWIGPHL
jgi:organic radical activating enzyme